MSQASLHRSETLETPPLFASIAAGVLLGASAGLALGGIERMILRAADIPVSMDFRWQVVWAVAGAGIGGFAGVMRLYGPSWAFTCSVILLGWVASAVLGTLASASGAPAALGVLFGTSLCVGVSVFLGHSGFPPAVYQGIAAFCSLTVVTLAPLHLHLIAGVTTGGSIGFSVIVFVLIAALSGPVAVIADSQRAPWLPIGALALIAAAGNLWLSSSPRHHSTKTPSADTPTVVLVAIDGWRADHFSMFGYTRQSTPTLERFARRAILYEDAHATSNWTAPSMGSVLTGQLPHTHGAVHSSGLETPLNPSIRTLAGALRKAGIISNAVVADPKLRTFSLDAGFSAWRDDPGQGALPVVLLPGVVMGLSALGGPFAWPMRAPADRVVDQAIDLVSGWPERGWLLMIHLGDAGGPFTPTPRDIRTVGLTTRLYPADHYDAALYRIDRELARLFEVLPKEAWIIVFGTRGVSLGEHHSGREDLDNLRFGHMMFEELAHVPLLVRGPSTEPQQVDGVVSLVQIAPTVLRIMGLPADLLGDEPSLSEPFGEPRSLFNATPNAISPSSPPIIWQMGQIISRFSR